LAGGTLPGQAIHPISAFRRYTPPPPRPSRRRHLTCFLPYRAPSPTGSSRRHSIAPSVQSIALRPLPYLLDLRARALDRPAPVGHLPPTKGARWPSPAVAFAAEQHVPLTAMMLKPTRRGVPPLCTSVRPCPAAMDHGMGWLDLDGLFTSLPSRLLPCLLFVGAVRFLARRRALFSGAIALLTSHASAAVGF
jgi:hypothetical protein